MPDTVNLGRFFIQSMILVGACLSGTGCATTYLTSESSRVDAASADPSFTVVSDWEFAGREGRVISTDHYRVYTTSDNRELVDRFASFMEDALNHYRSAIVSLPAPGRSMESYVFDDRREWVAFTEELMGGGAPRYTRIRRGGFATAGRAVFWDIGLYDTMAIAAHEGWHQYTQRTFRDRLPIWLEEGLGTFMEGHRWNGSSAEFNAWVNPERFDQLRVARYRDRLKTLKEVLTLRPEELLDGSSADVLDFYAQVWALVHFLNEGAGGKYRSGLERLLTDAAGGQVRARVEQTFLVGPAMRIEPKKAAGATVLFQVYFNADFDEVNAEYKAFIDEIVAAGARQKMLSGTSPVQRHVR